MKNRNLMYNVTSRDLNDFCKREYIITTNVYSAVVLGVSRDHPSVTTEFIHNNKV